MLLSLIALERGDMASITIRNLNDDVKARLRVQAARHGRSMEEEARDLIRSALARTGQSETECLARSIRRRFADLDDVELEIAPREPIPEPPELE